jgi:hypothetical protein
VTTYRRRRHWRRGHWVGAHNVTRTRSRSSHTQGSSPQAAAGCLVALLMIYWFILKALFVGVVWVYRELRRQARGDRTWPTGWVVLLSILGLVTVVGGASAIGDRSMVPGALFLLAMTILVAVYLGGRAALCRARTPRMSCQLGFWRCAPGSCRGNSDAVRGHGRGLWVAGAAPARRRGQDRGVAGSSSRGRGAASSGQ